jgi:hypothetical protein
MVSQVVRAAYAATGFVVLVFCFLADGTPDRAQAASILWTLHNGGFNDGGSVSGSFVWDTDLATVTSWNFAVSGGDTAAWPPVTYSNATSSFDAANINITPGDDLIRFKMGPEPTRDLRFSFADGALDTPSVALLMVGNNFTSLAGYIECNNCAPGRLGVDGAFFSGETPLPPALPLFASGLGAVGLFGWRRRRNARVASAA